MTEDQALGLARAMVKRIAEFAGHAGTTPQWRNFKATEEVKEALMSAYNDGWENGFEAGKGDRW